MSILSYKEFLALIADNLRKYICADITTRYVNNSIPAYYINVKLDNTDFTVGLDCSVGGKIWSQYV